jgi:drug/metabolite transporter (DMT)-like permease
VFGVLSGWLFLGETLTGTILVSLALVAAGIVLTNWPAKGG